VKMSRQFVQILIPLSLVALVASCGKKLSSFEQFKSDGEKAFTDARYAEARACFAKALAIKPSDRDALYLTGLAYKRDYIYDSALSFLRRADILYPGSREINLDIYQTALETKSWQDVVRSINVLVATGDSIDKYYEVLVRANLELNEPLNVVYYLRRLVAQQPDEPNYTLQLINALVAVDSLDTAVKVADSALAKFGPRNEFVASRANLDAYHGKYAQAEKTFRTLLATDTVQANAYRLNLANVLSMQKDKAKKREAIELYKQIRDKVSDRYKIDSLITELQKSL
jgi:tetratricopeptide (TPR) repeat protein